MPASLTLRHKCRAPASRNRCRRRVDSVAVSSILRADYRRAERPRMATPRPVVSNLPEAAALVERGPELLMVSDQLNDAQRGWRWRIFAVTGWRIRAFIYLFDWDHE